MSNVPATTAQVQAAMRTGAVVCARIAKHAPVNPGTEKRGQTIDPEIGGFML